MKIKKKLLYIVLIFFVDFIQNALIYVGDNGQNEQLGTFQSPFQNISYALTQINNSFNNVEILLLENLNEDYLSGNFSFRDINITIR